MAEPARAADASLDDLLDDRPTLQQAVPPEPPAEDEVEPADSVLDEDEFAPPERTASRLTVVLLVALIFLLGFVVGVLAGRLTG